MSSDSMVDSSLSINCPDRATGLMLHEVEVEAVKEEGPPKLLRVKSLPYGCTQNYFGQKRLLSPLHPVPPLLQG